MANLERIYTIPLGGMYEIVRQKRGKRAVKFVKEFALRHMKAEAVKMSEGVNSLILRDGIQKPPRRIKVRIVKDEKSLVAKVWLIGEEEKLREIAEKRKKEEESVKKEQEKKAEDAKKKEEAAKKEGAARKEAQKAAPKPADKPAAAQIAQPKQAPSQPAAVPSSAPQPPNAKK